LHNLLSFCQKDKDLVIKNIDHNDFNFKKGEFDRAVKQELQKKNPKIIEKTQSKKDLTEAEMWKNTWEQFVDVFLNSKLLDEVN